MDVSKNRGIPKSSIFTGFSIINHPFWGITIFGNIHIKGNQWVFISPDHKAGYFWGSTSRGGWLISHECYAMKNAWKTVSDDGSMGLAYYIWLMFMASNGTWS